MSTEGSVGPEGSIELEVTHDGKTTPVQVHPIVAAYNWLKGLFGNA